MKKRTILASFCTFSLIIGAFSYIALCRYHVSVTEAALSLCGDAIRESTDVHQKSKKVKDLLTFARISDEEKLILLEAIIRNDPQITALAEKMRSFSYTPAELQMLRAEIRALQEESIHTFLAPTPETAIENAETLVKKLYGRRVSFQSVKGNGTDFQLRYYCGNICIDACEDGSIRYTADIEGSGGVDPLLALLFPESGTVVESNRKEGGFLRQTLRSALARAEVSLDPHTNRVFAAKILFKS